MTSTKNIIDHHLQSFNEGDLKGVLADYAPGAVLFTPAGPLRGVDEIRPLFQAMIAEFGKPGATFNLKEQLVEDDYAYILWTAETADNVYELGTDTFVVRDGKIVNQSFTSKMAPKAESTRTIQRRKQQTRLRATGLKSRPALGTPRRLRNQTAVGR